MNYDPAKLDHLEIISLLAKGLIEYFTRVTAGEEDPFPYPEALIRGFNQLNIACALQDVERVKRCKSIPEFVYNWGILPLTAWSIQLEITPYTLTGDDYLIDPDLGLPTQLCQQLAQGLKLEQSLVRS